MINCFPLFIFLQLHSYNNVFFFNNSHSLFSGDKKKLLQMALKIEQVFLGMLLQGASQKPFQSRKKLNSLTTFLLHFCYGLYIIWSGAFRIRVYCKNAFAMPNVLAKSCFFIIKIFLIVIGCCKSHNSTCLQLKRCKINQTIKQAYVGWIVLICMSRIFLFSLHK